MKQKGNKTEKHGISVQTKVAKKRTRQMEVSEQKCGEEVESANFVLHTSRARIDPRSAISSPN